MTDLSTNDSPSPPSETEGGAGTMDRAIGAYLRECRNLAGLTMVNVGDAVGISYQQVQKYERGTNSLAVHRLIQICGVVKGDPHAAILRGIAATSKTASAANDRQPPHDRAVLDIARAISKVTSPRARHALLALAKDLGGEQAGSVPPSPLAA